MEFPTPVLFASRCLGFEECRYNGQSIYDDFVDSLEPFVEFVTVCPEMEIGLGVPREPVRIVRKEGEDHLIQPSTGKDITDNMNEFSEEFLNDLEVDGFILKANSPSCGPSRVKIYPAEKDVGPIAREEGMFAREVRSRYPQLPIESEKRLNNLSIRHHFLAKLYSLADFRCVKNDVLSSGEINELMDYHSKNKFLFKAYNQKELQEMEKIVGQQIERDIDEVVADYEKHLWKALEKGQRYSSTINVLHNLLGYFKDEIEGDEKRMFLNTVEMYKEGRSPLTECMSILRSWILRFDMDYLQKQTIFEPYPKELRQLSECASRRDYWGDDLGYRDKG